jgi:hypothetical protein
VVDAARSQLVGRRTRHIIRLADQLRVEVAKANRFKRQVDFRLAAQIRLDQRSHWRPVQGQGSDKIKSLAGQARPEGLTVVSAIRV